MWRRPFVLWPLLAIPFVYLLTLGLLDRLGADPAKELVHSTGEYALWLLMLVMLASPLQFIVRRRELMQIRRPLGVAVFVYMVLHLMLYVVTYLGFSVEALIEDLVERPYIIVGSLAFLVALPMAVTSNSLSVRKMGRSWGRLHKAIYPMSILICIHIIWQVKFDYGQAFLYSAFFVAMLLLRIPQIRAKLIFK